MSHRLSTAALLTVLTLALAGPASAAVQVKKAPAAKTQLNKAFKQLSKDIASTPRKALSTRDAAQLARIVARAKSQSRSNPCGAIRTLRGFDKGLRKVKVRKLRGRVPGATTPRGLLKSDLLVLRVALMQQPKARRCGGDRSAYAQAKSRVRSANNKQLRVSISLPAPTFASRQVGGKEYQQIFMEGLGETGDVGKPGIPVITQYFGIPQGAGVQLKINKTEGYDLDGVELFPHQKNPVDLKLPEGAPDESVFADPPFSINNKAYGANRPYPAKPSDANVLGMVRDIKVGGLDFAGAQYRPRSDRLHVFTSIDVTIKFNGDNSGQFAPADALDNPWQTFYTRSYESLLSNYSAIRKHLGPIRHFPWCGAEMLVITSDALKPAADTFAVAKRAQGVSTSVHTVGSASVGSSNTEIQSFIRGRLAGNCIVRPTYVVLLGNTAAVPTFHVPCSPGGNPADCNIASDLPYSLDGVGTDLFADVMLGRIPAIDLAGANAVVNKIINYQNTLPAPAGDDFYRHATTTAYFEPALMCVLNDGHTGTPNCNPDAGTVNAHWEIDYANHQDTRGFTKTSETINVAMRANGYNVDRLYTTDDSNVIPERYYTGEPIPSHLRRPTFPWNSNSTNFLDAYNQGRFLILHRDHGWPDGWAEPTLHSGHVPLMTNGTKLPVIFGINCASAMFDVPDHPSFVELQLEKADGGAVAAFGDTRNSPSFPNNHMALGFFDALFPNVDPDYGDDLPTRRLGDVLVRGKQYMASREGSDWHGAGDTYVEHYLYHLLGDPSMEMRADEPRQLNLEAIITKFIAGRVIVRFPIDPGDPPPFNTVVTLMQNGTPIGRALVGLDGTATIDPNALHGTGGLSVAILQDGALPATDTVEEAPAQPTTLTLNCPSGTQMVDQNVTFSGKLAPGFAGAKVSLEFTNVTVTAGPSTFTRTVATDAEGNFSDTFKFSEASGQVQPYGSWRATARFEGQGSYLKSASDFCSFATGSP